MATFIIIGCDGKQYGPISTEEVRKWVAEDRLNAQSLVKEESDAEFRPLSKFPEFTDLFGIAAQTSTPPSLTGMKTLVEGDYELDIGACISNGWALVKNNFWPVV